MHTEKVPTNQITNYRAWCELDYYYLKYIFLCLHVFTCGAGRPKNTWIDQMKKYQQRMDLSDDTIQDRNACRRVLRSNTHTSGGA